MSISPLRQRMIDDMTARHFGEKAQRTTSAVSRTSPPFLERSPETADLRMICDTVPPASRSDSSLERFQRQHGDNRRCGSFSA